MKNRIPVLFAGTIAAVITFDVVFWLLAFNPQLNLNILIVPLVVLLTFVLTLQSLFTLVWMLYAWENPEDIAKHKSPTLFSKPLVPFTALLPARHEEAVIQDTIKAVDRIDYPDELKEILVLCRKDDVGTITKAQETIRELGKNNIKLVVFNSNPVNKPHALNIGLHKAKYDVIAIFDAEDEPHPDIYHVVNTIMVQERTDVVQSGVQLMNFRSHWFSALNVMEYFLWFKSGLHFFAKFGKVTPLGGNTVFLKKVWLQHIGGWDENCLTEDADIGIRLVAAGAKTRIVYDEIHATREETPPDTYSFIKQRTRWNQGFLQILEKGDWKKLPLFRQKVIALYVLLTPFFQTLFLIYLPFGLLLSFTQKMPILITLVSFIPLYLFALQLLIDVVNLRKFTKLYGLKFPFWMPLKILVTFYPYQFVLMVSSIRAIYRFALRHNGWEKTFHTNVHRNTSVVPVRLQYAN